MVRIMEPRQDLVQSIPLDLKLRLFRTTCLSVLMYGCEIWIITKDVDAKLNAFVISCSRIMLNIKRLDNVSNDRIHYLSNTTLCCRRSSCVSSNSFATSCAWRRTNPPTSTRCVSRPKAKSLWETLEVLLPPSPKLD